MTYVITQPCCNDASCVVECPVDCIRPRPDDPNFATTEMLYIDPDTCIDCGACVEACPVDAIFPEDDLSAAQARFSAINAEYYQRHPLKSDVLTPLHTPVRLPKELGTLRVAVVGSGPAACYAAEELLLHGDVQVEIFERLPAPWGLLRTGVAPDHPETKNVADMFASTFKRDAVEFHLGVDVGRDITHAELTDHHHAVVYAVGAAGDRRLGIPGEQLPGSHSATEFVAWYNGHPDYAERTFDLSGERVVVVGNGNVALDVARILTVDPDVLAKTDIADYALEALRHSAVREVVVLGRRGPLQAAYTTPEFMALGDIPGVDVVIDPVELELDPESRGKVDDPEVEPTLRRKLTLAQEFAGRSAEPTRKRIVFRYLVSPIEISGADRVQSVEVAHNELKWVDGAPVAVPTDRTERIDTELVLRSVGYRGQAVAGLPFDEQRGVIPNEQGRVLDADGHTLPGVFVTGWIKRGPRGVIGSNRADSAETVARLIDDFRASVLACPKHGRAELVALLAGRVPELISKRQWRAVDAAERDRGRATGRPRVKYTDVEAIRQAARTG